MPKIQTNLFRSAHISITAFFRKLEYSSSFALLICWRYFRRRANNVLFCVSNTWPFS